MTGIAATRALATKLKADKVLRALDQVEAGFGPYYEIGRKMAKRYVAEGPAGGNKMMAEFDKGSETLAGAMESLVAVAEELSRGGQKQIDEATDQSRTQLQTLGYVLYSLAALSLLIAAAVFAYSHFGVFKPLRQMTDIMRVLAEGNTDVSIPSLDRRDEIGAMGKAVEPSGITPFVSRRWKRSKRRRKSRTPVRRTRDMMQLADAFEGAAGKIVMQVSSASTQLEQPRNPSTETAELTQQLSTKVTTISEEASTNVKSVASATMEMETTVREIGRQVEESSRIVGNAVSQADQIEKHISSLSTASERIGGFVA